MNLAKFLHRKDGDQYDDVAIKVSLFLKVGFEKYFERGNFLLMAKTLIRVDRRTQGRRGREKIGAGEMSESVSTHR